MKTLLSLLLLLAINSIYAETTSTHKKALFAGYKSMFTCSATFNAGRNWEDIQKSELNKVYIDYQPAFDEIPDPVINKKEKYISTKYDEHMPPRIAVWRPLLGCSALPIGAKSDSLPNLPRINFKKTKVSSAELAWPNGDRLEEVPFSKDINENKLNKTVAAAFDLSTYGEGAPTSAVVVVHDGNIVAEQYRKDFDLYTSQRTWSVAKSIAASVIGVAVQKGILDIHSSSLLREWQIAGDPRSAITLENLLHMSSGLWSTGSRTDDVYFGGGIATDYAVKNPLEAIPGTRWKYANNDTLLAVYGLKTALNNEQAYWSFPFEELLFKIGMFHTQLETDWHGNFILSSQVWTTARDLARLGLLYLNNGKWNGEQILPDWWPKFVRTLAPRQPLPEDAGGRAYGAQFWLYKDFTGIPEDAHAMLGNRGQIVMLVPSRKLVIVRRGYDQSGRGGVRFDEIAFTRDILKAIK